VRMPSVATRLTCDQPCCDSMVGRPGLLAPLAEPSSTESPTRPIEPRVPAALTTRLQYRRLLLVNGHAGAEPAASAVGGVAEIARGVSVAVTASAAARRDRIRMRSVCHTTCPRWMATYPQGY